MKVRADYIKITDSTVLTTITIQFERKDLQFQQKDNVCDGHGQHLRAHHVHRRARGEHV